MYQRNTDRDQQPDRCHIFRSWVSNMEEERRAEATVVRFTESDVEGKTRLSMT